MARFDPVEVLTLAQRGRDKLFSLAIARSFESFGRSTVVQPPFRVAGAGDIALGAQVFVGAGSWFQALPGDEDGDGPKLSIGDRCSFAGSCVLSAVSEIRIGAAVLVARNVYVADHRHRYEERGVAVLDQGLTEVAPVVIGDGAWLGQNVVVCPGVRIGAGAVIGANAVVTRDVPAGSVAVGAPARVIRGPGAADH